MFKLLFGVPGELAAVTDVMLVISPRIPLAPAPMGADDGLLSLLPLDTFCLKIKCQQSWIRGPSAYLMGNIIDLNSVSILSRQARMSDSSLLILARSSFACQRTMSKSFMMGKSKY